MPTQAQSQRKLDPSRADHPQAVHLLAAGHQHFQLAGALRQLGKEHQQIMWGTALQATECGMPRADWSPSSVVSYIKYQHRSDKRREIPKRNVRGAQRKERWSKAVRQAVGEGEEND